MSYREINPLSVFCLKQISKAPSTHIDDLKWHKAFSPYPISLRNKVSQDLIDYITDAGRMTDAVIPLDGYNSDIVELSLKNSKVTENYLLDAIKRCPNLASIDVSGCLLVDDNVLKRILQICPSLINVQIRNCRKMTDASAGCLITHCKMLRRINMGGNANMSPDGLLNLVRNHPNNKNFEELYLSGLPITEEILQAVVECCPKLAEISIGYAIITDNVLRNFLQSIGPRLQRLSISWMTAFDANDSVSSDILEFIASTCPRLTSLDVSGLRNITVQSIQQFVETKKMQVMLCIVL